LKVSDPEQEIEDSGFKPAVLSFSAAVTPTKGSSERVYAAGGQQRITRATDRVRGLGNRLKRKMVEQRGGRVI